ncbi:MAG: hypothetical protein U0235_32310 [Polyangiaceae bacterium]
MKTLEEPPPHVKFIFATTEVHKVPGHHPLALPALRLQASPRRQTIAKRLRHVLGLEKIDAEEAAISTSPPARRPARCATQ